MSNVCVYCGTPSDLNTEFTISVDDTKVKVFICDKHAEEATVKTARDAYILRQSEIQKVLEQARALGLNISTTASGIVVANTPPQQQSTQPQTPQAKKNEIELGNGPNVVSTDKLDSRPGMRSVGGSTEFGGVESLNSYNQSSLTDKLSSDLTKGVAKLEVFEGREGIPITIPTIRKDGTGTTTIQIRKTENDRTLQERFKRMAGAGDEGPDFRHGYSGATRDCPMCNGTGRSGKDVCQKCGGKCIISVY